MVKVKAKVKSSTKKTVVKAKKIKNVKSAAVKKVVKAGKLAKKVVKAVKVAKVAKTTKVAKTAKVVKSVKAKKIAKKIVVVKKIKKSPIRREPIKKETLIKIQKKEAVISNPVGVAPYTLKKGEEYMSTEQLKHFEDILKNWKEQLMQRADVTKHNMQDSSSVYADVADRAYQEEEFSRELRTRDRERKLLKKIDEALDRIKDNTYGYCDDCGSEIGLRRLEARPTATQCIECKTISELKEKQVGEVEE